MCAHGFLTLADETLLHYHASTPYNASTEQGLRYDDPVIGILWPREVTVLSPKDTAWPLIAAA
jgi:dTDP-4-dehydrorhamnose 3,5-epimerase